MINCTQLFRTALTATAVVTAAVLSTSVADADTFIPLPGGTATETLGDGTSVTIRIVGESANINPSMGSTPIHRNAWVSGIAEVELSQPARMKIKPGYVVGCQVNIAGGGANGGGTFSSDWEGQNPSTSGNVSGNLSLGPGQAKKFYLLDVEIADAFGDDLHVPFAQNQGTHGRVTWTDSTLGLTGCAGYAQARVFAEAEVETGTSKEIVTVWGQPFSLG